MRKPQLKGNCQLCGKGYAKAGMGRHLVSCMKDSASSFADKRKLRNKYLICAFQNPYWLYAEFCGTDKLFTLDRFLRNIWLECCGHLSSFEMNGRLYEENPSADPWGGSAESMNKSLSSLLTLGDILKYQYDFGSTTYLNIRVAGVCEGLPSSKPRILAINEEPTIACEGCEKKSSLICSQCFTCFCKQCRKKHECVVSEKDDYMVLGLVNSPRTGVCGYEG